MTSSTRTAAPETSASDADAGWSVFDATTSRWGRLTLIAALIVLLTGPGLLAAQHDVGVGAVVAGVATIGAAFGVVWFVEPISYFPILGPASMYQAFLIGNNSNKLVPAAVVAQARIGARPGTRRGQLASVLAICGAATTHVLALVIFVGLFGTLLVEMIPASMITTIQTSILPAIMGAVVVQICVTNFDLRLLSIAGGVSALVVFVLTPLVPVLAYIGIGVSVLATVALVLVLPGRRA